MLEDLYFVLFPIFFYFVTNFCHSLSAFDENKYCNCSYFLSLFLRFVICSKTDDNVNSLKLQHNNIYDIKLCSSFYWHLTRRNFENVSTNVSKYFLQWKMNALINTARSTRESNHNCIKQKTALFVKFVFKTENIRLEYRSIHIRAYVCIQTAKQSTNSFTH